MRGMERDNKCILETQMRCFTFKQTKLLFAREVIIPIITTVLKTMEQPEKLGKLASIAFFSAFKDGRVTTFFGIEYGPYTDGTFSQIGAFLILGEGRIIETKVAPRLSHPL